MFCLVVLFKILLSSAIFLHKVHLVKEQVGRLGIAQDCLQVNVWTWISVPSNTLTSTVAEVSALVWTGGGNNRTSLIVHEECYILTSPLPLPNGTHDV